MGEDDPAQPLQCPLPWGAWVGRGQRVEFRSELPLFSPSSSLRRHRRSVSLFLIAALRGTALGPSGKASMVRRRRLSRWTAPPVLLVTFGALISLCCAARASPSAQNLEAEKLLERLNKPAIKTIQSPDGDIIDCVQICHQPAFDLLLLQNHTIQMSPSVYPEGPAKAVNGTRRIKQPWHSRGSCPVGTVPKRRTRTDDVLRASSADSFGKKNRAAVAPPRSAELVGAGNCHEHAIAFATGDTYYGAGATINVWGPRVEAQGEFSVSQIWVLGGSFGSDLNSIEAGWQVNPQLYGDRKTRIFTYWTSDDYRGTGCYNLLCSGFIQTNKDLALGAVIDPLSSYGADQYDIDLLIWKDPKHGNWWVKLGSQLVGYWPASLFSYLATAASVIEWGGEVMNSKGGGRHTTTQMGSGGFPAAGFGRVSYFRNLRAVDKYNREWTPAVVPQATHPRCYDVSVGGAVDRIWGRFFYYGGPGRNPSCP